MAGGGYRWLHEDDQKVLQARWATWISRESVGGGGGGCAGQAPEQF